MSGLLAEIQANKTRARTKCAVDRILKLLDKDDRADLEAALADESVPAAAIARVLANRGLDINPNGERIRVHRREQCGCARR